MPARGWWNLACWNGLSAAQQHELITRGTLEIGYHPNGECPRGAEMCIETMYDEMPGPRFYCAPCALDYVKEHTR